MADLEPSSEKRERILQALDQASQQGASSQEEQDGKATKPAARTEGRKKDSNWGSGTGESTPFWELVWDCFHVNAMVLENKLIYFMLSAGTAGVLPFLSTHGLTWGLPPWHFGLAVGAGLLVAFVFVPVWGFAADKLRWHRGMLWAVVLLWMAFTILAVYLPYQPKPAPCEVAQGLLLETLDVSCEGDDFNSPESSERRHSSFGYLGHYPVVLETWPEPCTVDIGQVCSSFNDSEVMPRLTSLTNSSVPDWEVGTKDSSPPPNFTKVEAPSLSERTPVTPEVQEAPGGVLRQTHLGWLYDQAMLHRASLVVFILAAAGCAAQISSFSLADAAALMSLGEAQRDRYGWQRCFGTLGFALSFVVVSVFLNESRQTKLSCGVTWEQTDYFLGVVVFAGFMTIGTLLASCLRFKHNDMSSQHTLGHVTGVIFSRKFSTVFVTAFFLSFCSSAVRTFLSWHLHELGGTSILLGAAILVFTLADILTSFCTVWIVKKAGYHIPLVVGIVGYCLVYLSYALLSRPGWVVVIEIIHGASYAVTLNTMTSFLASSVALVSQASVQGLLNGIYWGLGPAAGTALFGFLVDVIGPTLSFYILTLVCVVYGLVFLVWNRNELPLIDRYLPGEYQPVNQDAD
ncbi:major facilitator superfamily domain-containing protein 6-like [Acanthaster planci]|uniref:Major facilitator superfamily domain-containing protein 6-like n=1 Tax=Acanthaster planci TaxID=133434 RepID=A0A8B7XYM1_ACAPL|nr:major facilitator superfamily domain-containing protein 6-like [Acanthaster planci]